MIEGGKLYEKEDEGGKELKDQRKEGRKWPGQKGRCTKEDKLEKEGHCKHFDDSLELLLLLQASGRVVGRNKGVEVEGVMITSFICVWVMMS